MKLDGRTCLLCDCGGTMPLDAAAIGRALGAEPPRISRQLCRAELDRVAAAGADGPVLVACTQERAVFAEALEDAHGEGAAARLSVTNIRERAGWSAEAAAAAPKIAALLAEAALPVAPVPIVPMRSEGVALVYGRDETAIEAARRLSAHLDVTVLLTGPAEVAPPRSTDFPVLRGTIRAARGHLGAFEVTVDGYAVPDPSSRRALVFGPARDGAVSHCDLILDLGGGPALFPHRRDGYLRADPGSPAAVLEAVLGAADLVGEFDKPRYVAYRPDLCAHSRNRRTGCTRCLEVCPAGAVTPAGDHVALDPHVCNGCGGCHAVCPTGAATYALPAPDALLERARVMLETYRRAGGERPVLLAHDAAHGTPLLDALARWGDGLPARVIPFSVSEAGQLGIEFFAAALANGAAEVLVLAPSRNAAEREGLARSLALAETLSAGLGFGPGRCRVVEADDPDALAAVLAALPAREGAARPQPFLPMGGKRDLMKLSVRRLHAAAPAPVDVLPLPPDAPFGRVEVDAAGCTLCFSCTTVCPTGALSDNPDRPQLSFTEDACVQCGLCRNTCPERVISLHPRLDFTEAARTPRVLKEEEPALCIRCGTAFGVKSTVDRIVARLEGQHWMYTGANSPIDRVRMCADCRVIAHSETAVDPYAGPPRPRPRTSDDYFREREGPKER
ncbi:MAG TPA: 4Fe-4S dicluster domain-containing protein [Azospirillaceae bacterium]|nr:4Fe-4S dicluster domain-containing protein [Azospirillaceae bacterium]